MANLSSTFEQLQTNLAKSLVACRTHPDSHVVHSLRTTTRRIEALLRKELDDHPRAIRLRGKVEKALCQLKKVRRAAGPVRDFDVQSMLTVEITEMSRTVASIEQRKELDDECNGLDHRLRRRRQKAAATLIRVLNDAEPALELALERIPDAMSNLHEISPLKTAESLVLRSSPILNDISSKSLHSYRKRTKAARYLAEIQETSRVAQRLAKSLKRILDDIGRWHDLMLLSQEAKALLGKRAILTRAINAERGRALRIATHSAGTIHQMQ